MRAPLRLVISAVAAVCVAVVAALTLSITLTSSLAALRAVGLGQAEALLQAAQVSSDNLFAVPQRATDTLQNTSRSAEWPWLANDANARGQWLRTGETLLANSGGQLYSLIVYFRDNTILLNGFAFSAAEPFVRPAPYIGSITVYGSAVNATDPEATPNQSPMPTQYTLQHVGNRSDVAPSHPDYAHALPRIEFAHFVNTSFWSYNMIRGTRNARLSVNAGTTAMAMYGAVRGFYAFVAPMHTRGDVPGRDPPFGFASAALAIEDLNAFMRRIKATRGTLAVAMDGFGYLLASSSDDSFQSTTRVPDGARPRHLGCAMTRDTGIVTVDEDSFEFCRAHASEYGNPALAKVVDDRALAFSRSPAVVLKSLDGEGKHFVGVAPVAIRYLGPTVHLILLVPETDIIGDVVQSRNVAIGVTCAAFVLVAAAAFAAITLLLAPLGTIAERMRRAADFDDDGGDESVSAMAEVAALQEAYYEMNAELNRVRGFVPQSVLVAKRRAAYAGSADDADDEDYSSRTTLSTVELTRSVRSTRRHVQEHNDTPKRASMTAAGAAAPAALAIQSLQTKHVAVLVANAMGFSPFIAGIARESIANVLGHLVEAVELAIGMHGGVLGGFHGDHFTATFNAVRPCAAAPRKACAAAVALMRARIGPDGDACDDDADGTKTLRLKIGVAAGKCQVGNVGTATAKTFSVVGPAFPQAVLLERLSRLYGTGCDTLVTARVYGDAATHFRFRIVDHVLLPPRQPTLIAALLGAVPESSTPPSQQGSAAPDGEWLYIVGDNATNDPNARLNAAFESLARGDLDACLEHKRAAEVDRAEVQPSPTASADGPLPPQPAEVGASDRLSALIAALRARGPEAPERVAPTAHAVRGQGTRVVGPTSAVPGFYDAYLRLP